MNDLLCNKLTDRFKFLCSFGLAGNKRYPLHPCCGDGWYEMIYDMCEEIEKELLEEYGTHIYKNIDEKFIIHDIKEKYGYMSVFCMYGASNKIWDIIHRYERLSDKVCEDCGKKGKTMKVNGWYRTECLYHYMINNDGTIKIVNFLKYIFGGGR